MNPTRATLAGLMILLAGSPAAIAQSTNPVVTNQQPVTPPRQPVVSIKFGGGTVGAYISALRAAAAPEPVNVVSSKEALEVNIGAIELTSVTLETALEAIEAAAGRGTYTWSIRSIHSRNAAAEPGISIAGAFAVEVSLLRPPQSRAGSAVESNDPARLQVFSIRDITESRPGDSPDSSLTYTPEVVLSAIQAGLAASGDDGVEIKYHQDSGLLIANGTPEQVQVVEDSIRQMSVDVKKRRDAAQVSGLTDVTAANLRAEMAKASVTIEASHRDIERCKDRLHQLKQLHESGNVSEDEVRSAIQQLENAESRAKLAENELLRLKAEMQSRFPEKPADPAASNPSIKIYDLRDLGQQQKAIGDRVVALAQSVSRDTGLAKAMNAELKSGTVIITGEPWAHDMVSAMLSAARAQAKPAAPAR